MDPVEVLEIYREYSCSGSPDLPRRTGSAADDVLHEKLLEIRGVISEGIPLVDPAPRRVLLRLLAKSNGIPDRQAPDLAAKTELYFDGRWNGIGSTDPPCRQGTEQCCDPENLATRARSEPLSTREN